MALMVRLSKTADETLSKLSNDLGETKQTVLGDAIEAYRRQLLLDRTNTAYAALRSNPDSWTEELEERALWDSALSDGLDT